MVGLALPKEEADEEWAEQERKRAGLLGAPRKLVERD